jgi:hypothetical protein
VGFSSLGSNPRSRASQMLQASLVIGHCCARGRARPAEGRLAEGIVSESSRRDAGAPSGRRRQASFRKAAGETPALVRLRRRSHSGVQVPVRPKVYRPVTEGYCVVETRGGELPEVNCQSVT